MLWPSAAARKDWETFDREIDQVLESVLAGDIGRKMEAMSTIIWNMGAERFGMEQRQTKGPQQAGENRRSREIAKLRGDLRRLKKAFRQAPEEEKPALKEMRDNVRERIKTLRLAECQRRDRRRREKERVKFTKKTFKYLSGLLGVKRSGVLKAPKEEVEEHLCKVHSDPRRRKNSTWKVSCAAQRSRLSPLMTESSDGRKSTTSSERLGEDLHRG